MLTSKIYRFSSLFLISLIAASAIYILLGSLFQFVFQMPFESIVVFALIFLVVRFLLRKQIILDSHKQSDLPTIVMLILGIILIFYRSTTYAFSFDDMVFHLPSGHYFGSIWLFKNFMPMDFATFLYPLLQVPYLFLVELLGLRAAILFLSTFQLLWFVGLSKRFALVIFPNKPKMRVSISLLFFVLYFIPELVATHVTFSSDFYSVLFALEASYAWMTKKSFGWMTFTILLAVFVKQSSGLFLLPIFVYFVITRLKTISLRDLLGVFPLVLSIAFYHIVLFISTGNPLAFLLNGIFHSPLYPIDNFRDMRWGPFGFMQIVIWPVVGNLTDRYSELTQKFKSKYFFALLSVFYIASAWVFVRTKKLVFMVLFSSYVFWAWQSGYGRYHLALVAIASVLLLNDFRKNIPKLGIRAIFVTTALVTVVSLVTFRIDVGQRGFVLEKYFPPKVSPYYLSQFQKGLELYGQDKFYDTYLELSIETYDTSSIIVSPRGHATFEAFLLNRYENKPVYLKLTPEDSVRILASERVSSKIKENLKPLEPSLLIDSN